MTSRSPRVAPRRPRLAAILAVAVLAAAGVVVGATPASAANFAVVNLNDSGAGSLRQAILDANANPGPDTVTFTTTGIIPLASTLTVTEGLTITGPGVAQLTVTRSGNFDMVNVQMATAGQPFTLTDMTLDGAAPFTGRGVVFGGATSTSDATFARSTFGNLAGATGGQAIFVTALSGSMAISDSDFADNSSTGSGGAILAQAVAGSISITGCTFDNNTAVGGGAAGGAVSVDSSGSAVTVASSTFTSNATSDAGGALYVADAGAVTITDVGFALNTAGNGGGAAYLAGVSSAISGSTFFQNHSTGNRGGAVYSTTSGQSSISNTSFIANTASLEGGAVYFAQGAGTSVTDSGFDSNVSESGGALFYSSFSAASFVTHSSFEDNTATRVGPIPGTGGAIGFAAVLEPMTISSSSFEGNSATTSGGPLPGGLGGAIYATGTSDALTVNDSTFLANFVGGDSGSGLSMYIGPAGIAAPLSITNSTVYEPYADSAIPQTAAFTIATFAGSGQLTVSHSTFTADAVLFVADNEGGAPVIFTHDLFDSDPAATPFTSGGTPASVQWSLFRAAADPGDISATDTVFGVPDLMLAPLGFNGGPTQTRLPLAGSPAIDTGNPAISGQPAFDQRGSGFDRVKVIIDIGSVEQARLLPATGGTINWLVPVLGGLLLLAGVGALVVARLRRAGASEKERSTGGE